MLVVALRGGDLVVVGTTSLPEPTGSLPYVATTGGRAEQATLLWELTWHTRKDRDRSERVIQLQPGQDPRLLPRWRPSRP